MNLVTPSPLLAFALRLDAVGSAACGLAQLLFAERLASALALPPPLLLGSGALMLAWAAVTAWLAARDTLPRWVVYSAIGFNLVWALDCLLLAFGGLLAPTGWGVGFLMLHVLAVLLFADLQYLGLKRSLQRSVAPAAA